MWRFDNLEPFGLCCKYELQFKIHNTSFTFEVFIAWNKLCTCKALPKIVRKIDALFIRIRVLMTHTKQTLKSILTNSISLKCSVPNTFDFDRFRLVLYLLFYYANTFSHLFQYMHSDRLTFSCHFDVSVSGLFRTSELELRLGTNRYDYYYCYYFSSAQKPAQYVNFLLDIGWNWFFATRPSNAGQKSDDLWIA